MSDMVGKVPLQEKIAELESRIVALEQKRTFVTQTTTTETTEVRLKGKPFGEHWNKMWEEFHLAMKEIYK